MFRYYNANQNDRHIADCVIRALSVLTDRTWRDVYDELTDLAGDVGMMFDRVEFVEDYLDDRYPRECHYAKTVSEFAREYPYGRYAVTMNGHITAIIDGVIIDTFDCSDRIVRCAWQII
ncbi:MAG: hypothetical protein IKV94_02705 [Clostridia bacterium]|nr:hypothetical protein [Clostridia bacterium]MBR6517148.1 hypothetical protein [Bacilli bacterium]